MKDQYGFDIQCEHSDLRVINENDDEEFVCTDGHFAGVPRQCYCNEKCSRYEPKNETVEDIIGEMTEKIANMMKEYPIDWVACAYKRATAKACLYHVELDSCGKPIWVRNIHDKEICRTCGTPKGETND